MMEEAIESRVCGVWDVVVPGMLVEILLQNCGFCFMVIGVTKEFVWILCKLQLDGLCKVQCTNCVFDYEDTKIEFRSLIPRKLF